MTELLQTGDVIEIKKGMKVYAKLLEKFIYAGHYASEKFAQTDIRVGDEKTSSFEIDKVKESLVVKIQEAFGRTLSLQVENTAIESFVEPMLLGFKTETFDTQVYEGEYVVTKTELSGGGSGHNDTFPDGHHVFCQKLNNGLFDKEGLEIHFYQTGSFTVTIKKDEIQPIRKLNPTFI
jgi:hypothetical protein